MRRARYFDVEDGVLLAVLPLVGLRGRDGGPYQKALPRRGILKNDRPIARRMNVFFHVRREYLKISGMTSSFAIFLLKPEELELHQQFELLCYPECSL